MKERLHPLALELIVDFETGGRAYYEQIYDSGPHWPEGRSGVTIGCGYDLGYEQRFAQDWKLFLSLSDFTRLARCLGKRGGQAQQAMSGVRGIVIPWKTALEVFNETSVPQQIAETLKAFPGSASKLPALAFGVLVSLVFNRGGGMDPDDRRAEMRQIRERILKASSIANRADLAYIADRLRSMKRLWKDDPKSDQDLVDRREAEAKLIEGAFKDVAL